MRNHIYSIRSQFFDMSKIYINIYIIYKKYLFFVKYYQFSENSMLPCFKNSFALKLMHVVKLCRQQYMEVMRN